MLSKAYIEDYHYIKLIIHEKEMPLCDLDNLYINNSVDNLKLNVFKIEKYDENFHVHTTFKGRFLLHIDYFVILDENAKIHVDLGKIMRTERFDVENYYEGPLGLEYHEDYTIFRVWSPLAKEIRLVLDDKSINLEYVERGLWEKQVNEKLNGLKYHYEVRVNEKFEKCLDPYAIASNADSTENYVIDFNKTYEMKNNFISNKKPLESIIYEVHLKDINVENKESCYLSLVDKIPYFKDLGLTHLQIMPLNVFGGVDEEQKDALYNWGYNPIEYNVPTGWYASVASEPYVVINELKQMIDEIHKAGLLVNLDVVFNHVYITKTFSLNVLVPGYVYRTDEHGFLTNGSGCGCDFASERLMNRRFIVDSLKHWAQNYHFDGFRFDLMGLLDYNTLILAEKELKKINPNIMLYGEGWNMSTGLPEIKRATINNHWALPNYAYFNDVFRNTMRGEPYNNKGYIYNQNYRLNDVIEVIKGSSSIEFLFSTPSQSINYVECHDNLTFFDKLKKDVPNLNVEDIDRYIVLSLGLVLLSLGIPFIHAGEELGRSKKGIDNTYNLGMDVNGLSYQDKDKHQTKINACKYFINFRKNHSWFTINNSDVINKKIKFSKTPNNTIMYEVDNFVVIFKNNKCLEELSFDNNVKLLFKGIEETLEFTETVLLDNIGVWIIEKAQ
ncbi:MAG: type I pullulanase [Bacilli bacterium]|nr:type I pullulanase [Bacilli bacterium]